MKTLKIRVNGLVQGVFFRKDVKKEADQLGIRGIVRNLEDGDVEIFAEGRDEVVNGFLEWCHKGPPHSEIKKVYSEEIKNQGFKDFRIINF